MEAKGWILVAALTFIAILPLTTYLFNSPQAQPGFIWETKSTILGILGGSWFSSDNLDMPSYKKPGTYALSPNLSSCHKSFGYEGFPVDCCPPGDESPVPFIDFEFSDDPSSPIRIRRPTHRVDAEYIAKYNKAVSIMKSLPYSDPRSFMRQANLHCIFCTGAYDQFGSKTPLNVHSSWLFFPWHRMVLYFHERILGSLIGDDSFALPFWAWDVPEAMAIPQMYLNSSLYDSERDVSHLPLSTVDLDFWLVEKGLEPQDQIEFNLAFMYNQMVSGAKKAELFMGCAYKSGEGRSCHGAGTMELSPHDTVHYWVGSNLNPKRENMGKFYSAARDPIFYSHHSNVDRLWDVWRELNKNKLDISDPDWLDTYFFFYDWDLKLVRIRVRDVLNMTKLGFAYEEIETPWLNSRPKPSIPPKVARHRLNLREVNEAKLKLRENKQALFPADFRPYGRSLDRSIRVKVFRPKINRTREEKDKEEEVIVVYGVHLKEDTDTKFDVYVNLVDETTAGPHFREFAGTFVHIPSGVKFNSHERDESMRKETHLKLGISELLEDLEADSDESIWVTLVPRSRSCVNTTVDGIRIEFIR